MLGASGLTVPALCLGSATFGGRGFFADWGNTDAAGATRMVDICLEAGLNMFDSADIYSDGGAEEVLGAAIRGRRDQVLISTKAGQRSGEGPNDVGTSRSHLVAAVEGSLRRLGTDYVDVFQLHAFDALTRVDDTLRTLDDLVRAGKVLHVGCSNFSGWHIMKFQAAAEQLGLPRLVANQAYYSLAGRELEWELIPLGLDQGIGTIVWSPLAWGRLTGKIRRGQPRPTTGHAAMGLFPEPPEELLFRIVDALDEVAAETGRTIPQIALNWLLRRPTISSVIIGARTEAQLRENLGAVGWSLTSEQVARLDAASEVTPAWPYWHQADNERILRAV